MSHPLLIAIKNADGVRAWRTAKGASIQLIAVGGGIFSEGECVFSDPERRGDSEETTDLTPGDYGFVVVDAVSRKIAWANRYAYPLRDGTHQVRVKIEAERYLRSGKRDGCEDRTLPTLLAKDFEFHVRAGSIWNMRALDRDGPKTSVSEQGVTTLAEFEAWLKEADPFSSLFFAPPEGWVIEHITPPSDEGLVRTILNGLRSPVA